MVLVNFGVLTTGFDAPKASAAVIGPSDEVSRAIQPDGRPAPFAVPKAGGTDACEIVTVVRSWPAGIRHLGGSVSELGGRMAVNESESRLSSRSSTPG